MATNRLYHNNSTSIDTCSYNSSINPVYTTCTYITLYNHINYKKRSKHLLKHLRQHEKGQSRTDSPNINVAMFPFSVEYTIYMDSVTQNKSQTLTSSLITTMATFVM